MYHIKNDKRCLRSAAKIGSALRTLMMVKPLPYITVSDIQRTSGTGRSTFYRLFDNIDDVLLYVVEEEFSDMIQLYRGMSWAEFTGHFIEAVVAESRLLLNVAESGKTYLIAKAIRTRLMEEAGKDHFEFDNISRYMISMFVGGTITLVTAWDENGRKETIGELAEIMQKAFDFSMIEHLLTRPSSAGEDAIER